MKAYEHITKQASKYLRWILVECARIHVRITIATLISLESYIYILNKLYGESMKKLWIMISTFLLFVSLQTMAQTVICDLSVGNLHATTNSGGAIPASLAEFSIPGARTFEATVVNYGPNDCPGFYAYWYIDGEIAAPPQQYGILPANGGITITASLSTTPGRHEVRVYVEPIDATDPNISNNVDEGYFWF